MLAWRCCASRLKNSAGRGWWHFSLLAAPFIYTLASLLIYDDADERGDSLLALWPLLLLLAAALAIANLFRLRRQLSLRAFFPLMILAAIGGTFMSQQLWGSTYAIWPLLLLLVAELLATLDGFAGQDAARVTAPDSAKWFVPALAVLISATLLVCGGFYIASEERLSYGNFPDGPVQHSAFPQLAGMATPGQYLPQFDELLRYAQANIPQDDGLILIPGEDPFYFATGRVPRFPVLLFDPTTDPYSPAETAALARTQNIRWLIVKRDLQIKMDPTPDRAETDDFADEGIYAGGAFARIRRVSALGERRIRDLLSTKRTTTEGLLASSRPESGPVCLWSSS